MNLEKLMHVGAQATVYCRNYIRLKLLRWVSLYFTIDRDQCNQNSLFARVSVSVSCQIQQFFGVRRSSIWSLPPITINFKRNMTGPYHKYKLKLQLVTDVRVRSPQPDLPANIVFFQSSTLNIFNFSF